DVLLIYVLNKSLILSMHRFPPSHTSLTASNTSTLSVTSCTLNNIGSVVLVRKYLYPPSTLIKRTQTSTILLDSDTFILIEYNFGVIALTSYSYIFINI